MSLPPPTPTELRIAVEVLKKLSERINLHGAHFAMQLPQSELGQKYAAQVEASASEQIVQIEVQIARLECWRSELQEQRRLCASQRI